MTGVLRVMEKQPFSVQEAALDSLMPSVVHCCVDATGIGAQIAERAQERWGEARVTPVTFTAPSKSAMAARVEAAVDADTLRIPRDEVVRRDLLSVTKEVSERGIVRLHAPASPDGHADRFWALALAMEAADAHPPVELTWMDEDGESEDAHFVELMG